MRRLMVWLPYTSGKPKNAEVLFLRVDEVRASCREKELHVEVGAG